MDLRNLPHGLPTDPEKSTARFGFDGYGFSLYSEERQTSMEVWELLESPAHRMPIILFYSFLLAVHLRQPQGLPSSRNPPTCGEGRFFLLLGGVEPCMLRGPRSLWHKRTIHGPYKDFQHPLW